MSLSIEKQINLVISHKKKVVELTNEILKIINEAGKKYKFDNNQKLLLKQLFNETVSEITTIASFCGSKERNWVNNVAVVIAIQNINLTYSSRHLLELWCTMINSMSFNFNKTPFNFLGFDFKAKWHDLEISLRSLVDRKEIPSQK